VSPHTAHLVQGLIALAMVVVFVAAAALGQWGLALVCAAIGAGVGLAYWTNRRRMGDGR
jgi:hypothetical protein